MGVMLGRAAQAAFRRVWGLGSGYWSDLVAADHTTTGIGHGHKEVASSPPSSVALAADTAAKWVTIQAYRSNAGYIAVGGSGVDADQAAGTGTGVDLAAGESVTLPIDNLADVHIDATVSGEGVRYTYGT